MPEVTAARVYRWALAKRTPNDWALEHVIGRPERYIVGTTGRQVGKTQELADWIDEQMSTPVTRETDRTANPIPAVGVLGPNYEKAELSVYQYIENITKVFGPDAYHMNGNKHTFTITDPLAGVVGATLHWMSAEEEFNVVGNTFSALGVDEAQAVPDGVWQKLAPTLDVRDAPARIFGTPDTVIDQTWFQGLWEAGQDPFDKNVHSFTVASWEAPWMNLERILLAKATMPTNAFRRLYGGEWVEDSGLFFTGYEGALLASVPEWNGSRRTVMAVDFAIQEDFNVVMVGDPSTRRAFYKERWNFTDPVDTYDRILEIWERFGKPRIYADETGMGRIPCRELRGRGAYVIGTTFTNNGSGGADDKMQLLRTLQGDLQHCRTMFPAAWEDLIREMKSFVYTKTPGGRVGAAARVGSHDDLPMTLVLLNKAFNAHGAHSRTPRNYLGGDGSDRESELRALLSGAN